MKLKHVDTLSGDRKRFRRRYPNDVAKALGESVFQVAMASRAGVELAAEHATLMAEFDERVVRARRSPEDLNGVSERQEWMEAIEAAEGLLKGVTGARNEHEARTLLAEALEATGDSSLVYHAVVAPNKEPPAYSLLDAKNMYQQERIGADAGANQINRLERVCRRLEDALGPLKKLMLKDLKREHARSFRDHMLAAKKADGSPLAASSIERELKMVSAMVNLALVEFDLKGKTENPFENLKIEVSRSTLVPDGEKRDPLPADIILAMRKHITTAAIRPELQWIWRMLEGTGCRNAEIIGLRAEDVKLEGAHPHIKVTWHEDRKLKTQVSNRSVPLVGDALEAAREALGAVGGVGLLFPRYATERGPDAVSQILMKHLRKHTKDPRHVVYSLRHNMKDYLVRAGVPERDEHRILGHSQGSLGDRVYGGEETKLEAAYVAMTKAHALMP